MENPLNLPLSLEKTINMPERNGHFLKKILKLDCCDSFYTLIPRDSILTHTWYILSYIFSYEVCFRQQIVIPLCSGPLELMLCPNWSKTGNLVQKILADILAEIFQIRTKEAERLSKDEIIFIAFKSDKD